MIAEAYAAADAASQTFGEWLRASANSLAIQQTVVYSLFAVGGQISHAVKKWLLDEICNPVDWFLSAPKRSVLAVLTNVGAALVYAGVVDTASAGWPALIHAAILAGYSADSIANKGYERA